IDLVLAHPRGVEAVGDRVVREAGVALDPGEALLLGSGDDAPVLDQRRGGVVIVGGDAQDARRLHGEPPPNVTVRRPSGPEKGAAMGRGWTRRPAASPARGNARTTRSS